MTNSQAQIHPTERFSNRVHDYVKYRPGYPEEIIEFLEAECGLHRDAIIADVGSGTGILSEMFLKHGNHVFGVEPNDEMRQAAEELLAGYPSFKSVKGTAESTKLEPASVNFVTAGQAFHWFNIAESRKEVRRILKPEGWVLLIWNDRKTDSTPFLRAYEQLLLDFSIDYQQVDHKNVDETTLENFFGHNNFNLQKFQNSQSLDFPGLRGRLLSSSYAPTKDHANYEPMLERLSSLFEMYQIGGQVTIEYDTNLYYGKIA
ncbi:class I SAM-dependent methyltransferase [candidate division KSB1 bacterium]|nr:class I SAM-dependent methyltransferase [candidate division KSB1 bacterium]NIR73160.1 class I SAM-dependent methyltransferase [candidate division KSB1 bacterium]NIS23867.1 class I SAM-dependent methyltransferase [candidate division KSB1 bacterium]NIT70788.1 class I SAM-dependent methyltransferase [candidate division KSB1 bacterium]NIU24516.1 class I SAM-dependent methyltransferase [candidate division KSB1 bacterium]